MFTFPQELTIVQVDANKKSLIEYIDNNDELSFNDNELTRVDTVGIQLILAAVTYISSQNKNLKWQSTSKALKQSIEKLGLNEAILNQYLPDASS